VKYGFKSIKSIVKIKLVANQPPTTWNMANAHEYGFLFHVNPQVDHPRWSQAKSAACLVVPESPDSDVQWLRQRGRQPLRRPGPEEKLLTHAAHPLEQSSGLPAVPRPLFRLAWRVWNRMSPPIPRSSSSTSPATGHPPDRRHAGCDSAAKAARRARPHPFPPHDRPFRVLHACLHVLTYLWLDSSSIFRPCSRTSAGARSSPRFRRVCVSGSAGRDFHRRVDSPPRRQALAEAAQPRLCHAIAAVVHYTGWSNPIFASRCSTEPWWPCCWPGAWSPGDPQRRPAEGLNTVLFT